MALLVTVIVQVGAPDGEPKFVQVMLGDLTINPREKDAAAEVALAKATLETLASRAVADAGGRLDDWEPMLQEAFETAGDS